jgi:thioredoxin-related protein
MDQDPKNVMRKDNVNEIIATNSSTAAKNKDDDDIPTRLDDVVDVSNGGGGGQITLFTKDECPFCNRVKRILDEALEKVMQTHPEGKFTLHDNTYHGII